jgi:DNA-directed RNA polymerase specialized sigma24 family protein
MTTEVPIISMASLVVPDEESEDQDGDAEGMMCSFEVLACNDPLDLIVMKEGVEEAVKEMTERQRVVIYLHLMGYSLADIGRALGCVQPSASDAYWRAVAHLKASLLP